MKYHNPAFEFTDYIIKVVFADGKYAEDMTRFRLFGGGWVQSTSFSGSFSFQHYLVFIGLYASLYIEDEETYKT